MPFNCYDPFPLIPIEKNLLISLSWTAIYFDKIVHWFCNQNTLFIHMLHLKTLQCTKSLMEQCSNSGKMCFNLFLFFFYFLLFFKSLIIYFLLLGMWLHKYYFWFAIVNHHSLAQPQKFSSPPLLK